MTNYAKADSFKETRDKDSSLAAALKTAVFNRMLSKRAILCKIMQSRPLPILSKRPEIRILAWRQLSKRRFSTRFHENALFYAKLYKADRFRSLKETRDKDSSLAAALRTAVFNPMLSKSAILCQIMQSQLLPILSKRPEIRIPAWRQLSKRPFSTRCPEKALAVALKTAVFNPML